MCSAPPYTREHPVRAAEKKGNASKAARAPSSAAAGRLGMASAREKSSATTRRSNTRAAARGTRDLRNSKPRGNVALQARLSSTVLAQDHFYSDFCGLPSTTQTQAKSMLMMDPLRCLEGFLSNMS